MNHYNREKIMKRKTIIAALAAVLACLIAVGCTESVAAEDGRFKFEDYNSKILTIITDTVTGVQYLCYDGGYDGGIIILVDADGKPLIQEEQNAD